LKGARMLGWVMLADWDNGRMMDHGGGTAWWWLMGVVMLAVLVAAVAITVWLVTRTAHATNVAPGDPNFGAKQILAERLARGEIDPAEYQERLSHLH
jgi:putative membrane protein